MLIVIQAFVSGADEIKEAGHVVHEEEDDKDREANLSNNVAVSVGRLTPISKRRSRPHQNQIQSQSRHPQDVPK
mgnify:CR=1 FL=1